MNDNFELSTNSKIYKFLYFCSNFFLTSWIVPRFDAENPKSHLRCLTSVCTLFSTLIKVIIYLLLCSVITICAIKTITIFEVKELTSFNPFLLMGFLFKFVVGILSTIIFFFILCAYLAILFNKIFEFVVTKIPNKPYFKLAKTYVKDRSQGLCRRITLVEDTFKKKDLK